MASDYSSIENKLNQLRAEIVPLRNLPALSLEFTTWPSKLFALVEAGFAYCPSSIPWKAEAEASGVRQGLPSSAPPRSRICKDGSFARPVPVSGVDDYS
ncbi:MAG: hypothetical protein CR217_11615 [Beijerinckiaceae bacterium]|nr:MAG: hypothetical protein CR217_11615 [Beijerinckiaceae bacterium]